MQVDYFVSICWVIPGLAKAEPGVVIYYTHHILEDIVHGNSSRCQKQHKCV